MFQKMKLTIRRYIKNREINFNWKGQLYILAFRELRKQDRGFFFSIYKIEGLKYKRVFKF